MVTGSCLCGQVKYEFRGQPRAVYYCHGSPCRKATGSSFATNMLVAEDNFVVTAGTSFIKAFQSSAGGNRFFLLCVRVANIFENRSKAFVTGAPYVLP